MMLITKELEKKLPKLGATANQENPLALCKLFTPSSCWTWYVIEYDPETEIAFGLVDGFETELGNFSMDELSKVKGPMGLPIERDLHWAPQRIDEIREKISAERDPA